MCSTISDGLKYFLAAVVALMLTACGSLQPGGSRDAVDTTGLNGRVVRVYENPYGQTLRAGKLALGQMGVPAVEELSDEVGTSIKAVLPGHVPVNVDIVDMGPGLTEVSVRAGQAGQWDRAQAERLQASIADMLAILPRPAVGLSAAAAFRAVRKTTPSGQEEPPAAAAGKRKSSAGTKKARTGPRPQFTIFFEANSDGLTPDQMKTLDKVARRILETPGAKVKLNGYTDSLGDAGYNRMISEARASVVKFYLVSKGIPPADIKVKGYGARNFIADNKTLAGRRKNRRVEIVIYREKRR